MRSAAPFVRHVRVAYLREPRVSVFVTIEHNSGRLTFTGVEGPKNSGDAHGDSGQLSLAQGDYVEHIPEFDRLVEVWKRWHLNDMRPGCEHQRGWEERPIDPSKPLGIYGRHFKGQRQDSWNMLTWVRRDEHPEGLLSFPCPTCGYKYGTRWLREEVPQEVLDFLTSLPDDCASLPLRWRTK